MHNKNKYTYHKSKSPLNKPSRNYTNSFINKNKNDLHLLEDFILPYHKPNTYNYFDCKPLKPKCF